MPVRVQYDTHCQGVPYSGREGHSTSDLSLRALATREKEVIGRDKEREEHKRMSEVQESVCVRRTVKTRLVHGPHSRHCYMMTEVRGMSVHAQYQQQLICIVF